MLFPNSNSSDSTDVRRKTRILGIVAAIFFVLAVLGPARAQIFGQWHTGGSRICEAESTRALANDLTAEQLAIESTVVAVDRSLCLSQQQADCLAELLESSWQSDWTETASYADQFTSAALREHVKAMSPRALAKFLRPSQISALSGPDQITYDSLVATPEILAVWTADEFAEQQRVYFESVAKLKVEEIQSLCDVTTVEIEGLAEVAQQTVNRMIAEQRVVYQQLREANVLPGLNASVSSADISKLQIPAAIQFAKSAAWQREVKECIQSTSFAKYQAREQRRLLIAGQLQQSLAMK